MWGQDCRCTLIKHNIRIIPMRVGTRFNQMTGGTGYEDHPHACGDKSIVIQTQLLHRGSSPCVWGQAGVGSGTAKGTGIIPMRVGTSLDFVHDSPCAEDHPHACGDKFVQIEFAGVRFGSSPCVWGQVPLFALRCTTLRIIPMRVGTS